mmetsp:Transcript_10919/g.16500  ORF Transcript_10919/g.16500 Transcript_10919/m.16500 type:complete len:217 (-) Transcript_10919:61-711(-)
MHLLLRFSSPDLPLGKLDKASLPQQTLMELVIEKIENKEQLYGISKDPSTIANWSCTRFDAEGKIVGIIAEWQDLSGSLQLEWLPLTTLSVNFYYNELTGTIALTQLPDGLCVIDLSWNNFVGTVDLRYLPSHLKGLNFDRNHLSGSLDLTQLPLGIKNLQLHGNDFEGETDFSRLPLSLERLCLSDNRNLSGTIEEPFRSTCEVRVHDTEIELPE